MYDCFDCSYLANTCIIIETGISTSTSNYQFWSEECGTFFQLQLVVIKSHKLLLTNMHKRIDRHILSKWTTQSQTNLKAGSTSFRISNLSTYLNNKKVTHMGKTKCKIFQHASHKGINHFCVVLNLYTSPCLLWMTHVKLLAYMCISTSKAKKVPQVLYA